MKYEVYKDIEISEDFHAFDFVSTGKNGNVHKRVIFTKDRKNLYHLAFGDVDKENDIDDFAVTNNGDRDKVLATVALIVDTYTDSFPDRWVYFSGSTVERNRLYRMVIGLHLAEIETKHEVKARINGQTFPFSRNGAVDAFLIKRKKIKFEV